METYIPITWLNDYIFCPYSIYLHQIYDEGTEEAFSAKPQQKGKTAHRKIDELSEKQEEYHGMYVISHKLRLYGKIDVYYPQNQTLIEYKYQVHKMFKGFYYQLWAQYFALIEMGYTIKSLMISSIAKNENIVPYSYRTYNSNYGIN